ncbi:sulfur carrier protein ThiS adenylyltransferase ThiF [Desulfitobacterium sp. AusDCA]|uniref:sulfur carrier protein ThiS adenylyltransferase ThiF n=1 Tax=Desulfitobacterium sp. AusDCA TaxID=3240383 RepID=UPI003DA76C1B
MNPLIEGLKKHFGEERLNQIQKIRVGIAGTGGLGSNVANHLVRSGFSHFTLIDFDRIEPSNLNRQFFFADQIGKLKVEALAENLRRINPDLDLELYTERISTANIGQFFQDCDIWVEALDQAAAKKEFVEYALKRKKFVVSASGMAGWGSTDTMLTHHWGAGLVVVGDLSTGISAECPPLSPRIGVAAAKEANVVLRWALGEERSMK